jgi:TonB family protein
MPMNYTTGQITFGLLPEPEGRSASFVVSSAINATILVICLVVGMMAKQVIHQHFEQTQIIFPHNPQPLPKVKPPLPIKLPQPPPVVHEVKMEAPKINTPQPEQRPKAVMMQAKLNVPVMRMAKPSVIMQPQPKAAMTAAMPAQVPQAHPSTAPVHLGQLFGVTPNPNANRPATVAAIGNPYGGMNGPAVAPHGVVGSAGIGNGLRKGSNSGIVGRVASAGMPGATGTANTGGYGGKVAAAGIPSMPVAVAAISQTKAEPQSTELEVLSKPPVRYTPEARQAKVQGDVVLRVTFMADGQVVVNGVVRGLGHGLDQEATREAEHIRFRPATRDGHPINLTTNIIITFQLA